LGRSALIVFAFVFGGCHRPPSAHIDVARLAGPRPPQVVARCVVDGLRPPVTYRWRLPPAVKQVGWSPPANEPAILVQIPNGAAPPGVWAACTAIGDGGTTVHATHALVMPLVTASPATARPGQLVTVRGGGFGPSRGPDDGLWLVPRWGAARPADTACKGARWGADAVSACVPATLPAGIWQLRVQAGGELALGRQPVRVAR
jgi:hypothetical protein